VKQVLARLFLIGGKGMMKAKRAGHTSSVVILLLRPDKGYDDQEVKVDCSAGFYPASPQSPPGY
jgi:hypothetical protein